METSQEHYDVSEHNRYRYTKTRLTNNIKDTREDPLSGLVQDIKKIEKWLL